MSGLKNPYHGRVHEHGGSDVTRIHWEDVGTGGAGGAMVWATCTNNGETVASQTGTSTTKLNLDSANLIESSTGLFTVVADGSGALGLAPTAEGTYVVWSAAQFFYTAAYDATILDTTVFFNVGGGGNYISFNFDGMLYTRGVHEVNQNSWYLGFGQMISVDGAALGTPWVWRVRQGTTHSLDVYMNVFAMKISETAA